MRKKKWNTEKIVAEFKKVHGNKYDYSKVEYNTHTAKVCIICPEHGEFWQTPLNHLQGHGCPKCKCDTISKRCKMRLDTFITKARLIHGSKYDYSKVEYKNTESPVCIICPEHGEFWQTPHKHLQGHGCPKCGILKCGVNNRMELTDFLKRSKRVHGDKYDYSKVEYVNVNTKVCIICPEHGEFWQTPLNHLQGYGCKECRKDLLHNKFAFNKGKFIIRAKQIHGDRYNYSNVKYVNSHTIVSIICPKHGEFQQKPVLHLRGCGCPKCSESKMEKYIADRLSKEGIFHERGKHFTWLKDKRYMHLDFYLPEYNIAIECQGIQHFEGGDWYCDKDKRNAEFFNIIRRDELKQKLCKEHGITIIYYTTYSYKKKNFIIYNDTNVFNTFYKIKKYIYDLRIQPKNGDS